MGEIDKKDLLVMKLVHYFMIKKNYIPVIIRGIDNEVWLENKQGEYRIIRIVTKNIFNQEQINFDINKTKDIASQIKKKTLNPFMDMLTIYTDMDTSVRKLVENEKHYDYTFISDENDLLKNDVFNKYYKDIKDDIEYKEEGFELLSKITTDITKKNVEENERFNNMYNKKIPIITYILMGLNVIMFIITMIFSKGMNDANVLAKFGANIPSYIRAGDYYRIITSMFLHASIFHIACNMYSLFALGPTMEHFFGRVKYLLIYLFSGIMGSLFVMVFQGEYSITVGASGAIFGLLGALVYFGYNYRGYIGNQILKQVVPVIAINLFIGFTSSNISNAGHIGGLLGGFVVAFMLGINDDKEEKSKRITGSILTVVLTGFMIYLAFFR